MPWLVDSEPWIEYRTRIDLLNQAESHPDVEKAYQSAISHPLISNLIRELSEWPGPILKSHKKAGHLLHKLGFLSDIGLQCNNPGIEMIANRVLSHRSSEGVFQIKMNIHPRYGGSGEDQLGWMLCDAPLVTCAMKKFRCGEEKEIQNSFEFLIKLQRENGWPCAVSPEFGKFRGPGKKADPCPYANLVMLKLLAQYPERHTGLIARTGIETILTLWERRREKPAYLFGIGTTFNKLKAPLIWYDILHVAEVLTQFPWVIKDTRLQEILTILRNKADENGKYTPESIWMDWRDWEFGQKKQPSKWITFLVLRILKRVDDARC